MLLCSVQQRHTLVLPWVEYTTWVRFSLQKKERQSEGDLVILHESYECVWPAFAWSMACICIEWKYAKGGYIWCQSQHESVNAPDEFLTSDGRQWEQFTSTWIPSEDAMIVSTCHCSLAGYFRKSKMISAFHCPMVLWGLIKTSRGEVVSDVHRSQQFWRQNRKEILWATAVSLEQCGSINNTSKLTP